MEKMRKSLAGVELSTRAKNVLVNLAMYWDQTHTWAELIDTYKRDPTEVEEQLLRTPGAGRVTVNEILDAIKPQLKGLDTTGQVVWLKPDQVEEMKAVLDKLIDGQVADLVDRNTLRALHALLSARTIQTRP